MTFKVYSIAHVLFAARHLVDQLRKLGHDAELVDNINERDNESTYILYGETNNPKLPKNYIVYQTEIINTHFFKHQYMAIIKGAKAVWEYNADNIPAYSHMNSNITVVSPGISPQPLVEKDIPVLFYGWIQGSLRRGQLLKEISKHIEVEVVTNLLGEDMWSKLARAKTVLNLHYYRHSPLELFRIHEALSFNCHVVSEVPAVEKYNNDVLFGDSAAQLVEHINTCNKKKKVKPVPHLDNLEEVRLAVDNYINRVQTHKAEQPKPIVKQMVVSDTPLDKKVAIIVPYRNRWIHLKDFRGKIPFYLKNKGIEADIHVIEQQGSQPFNRGKLLNAGFLIAKKHGYSYYCTHDVDMIPVDADYSYPDNVTHISQVLNKKETKPEYFGGVVLFTAEQFEQANGYPNDFWGWGYEDDAFREAVLAAGLEIDRRPGKFITLPHPRLNSQHLMQKNKAKVDQGIKDTGLSDCDYELVETTVNKRCTVYHHVVAI